MKLGMYLELLSIIICSNYDLGLTLTDIKERSNFVAYFVFFCWLFTLTRYENATVEITASFHEIHMTDINI